MRLSPLPQGFGAEVDEFDVHGGRAPADVVALRDAYDRHQLLIFRDCGRIAPERQVEMMGWLGPISPDRNPQGQPWTTMDNEQAQGACTLPFHSDLTYMEHPLEGLSLHAIEMPAEPSSTTFVSSAVGRDALDDELRAAIGERKARHFLQGSAMAFDWPPLEQWRPIHLRHPRTGRSLLFVTEHHADRVEGLSDAEGEALLGRLFVILYAEPRQYEHVWRPGDLLIWDNLAVQHARTRPAPQSAGRRLLQRVALGRHGFVEQIEAARRKQEPA